MQEKLKDKLPIFVCERDLCKLASGLMLAICLIGCAAGPQVQPGSGASERDPEARATAAAEPLASAPDDAIADLDADLLFHVLAAERLAAVGDFEAAIEHFLEAARLGDDPDLARQVVSLALSLQDWSALVDGAVRWQELAPAERAPARFLALGLLNLDEIESAADVLAEQIELAGDERAAWREAVMLLAAAATERNAEQAMSALMHRAGLDPNSGEALRHQSLLEWQLGRSEAAMSLAAAAAEAADDVEAWLWAAQLASAADDLEQALDNYRRARALDPENQALALSEAETLRQLDQLDDAIAVLAGLPPGSELLYLLGSYQFQAGELEDAAVTWHRLAALDAVDDPMHHAFLTGFLAELLDMNDEALDWYQRIDSGSQLDRARLRRAVLESQRGELDLARELLQAVRLTGNRELVEQAWLIEGDILREAGRASEAVDLLSGALRQNPDSIALLYTRAICAIAIDDLELAEQDFRRILQIEDDNAMALNALGYTLTDRTDRHEEAYRLIRRALELEPDSPAIQDSMGWVYFRLGQPEKALPYLEQALQGEDNPEIAAHLGEVLWYLGREDDARKVLFGAFERFPDDDYLGDTMGRLGLIE